MIVITSALYIAEVAISKVLLRPDMIFKLLGVSRRNTKPDLQHASVREISFGGWRNSEYKTFVLLEKSLLALEEGEKTALLFLLEIQIFPVNVSQRRSLYLSISVGFEDDISGQLGLLCSLNASVHAVVYLVEMESVICGKHKIVLIYKQRRETNAFPLRLQS